jgi:2-methylisocitrate lyase-like PEP mutase family enzyme
MISQKEKVQQFNLLHIKGDPLVLFNIWDAGSARAVEEAGAKAIATGSWSVAAANGFGDGEEMPLDDALENIKQVVANVTLPVTLDFEGGYTASLDELRTNIEKVIDAGAVGINFEDQVVGGDGLYSIEEQTARIAAIRSAAEGRSVSLFINARTDVFLKTYPATHTAEQLDEAIERADAYAAAGASGLFAPGLRDPEMIKSLCERSPLPVNIMVLPDAPTNKELAELGVARISYGPGPYRQVIENLKTAAASAFSF